VDIEFYIEESKVIEGVYLLTPTISRDIRGSIWTSFLKKDVERLLPDGFYFKHDKFSTSKHNVLRGIHSDTKSWKLVTCVSGEIQQVVVDLRKKSKTYLDWQDFLISDANQKMILIPPHIGNAYYVVSDQAVYHYKLAYQGGYIDADKQISTKWNDKRIGISWLTKHPILSERDQ
jgi:dTDP-4-dehydrorhamnose 3,5-epimerase